MRVLALLLLQGSLAVSPSSPRDGGPTALFESLLQQGDAAFASRGEAGRIEAACGAYSQASTLRPGEPAAELRLARAQAFLAQGDPVAARAAWSQVSRAAERALRNLAPSWARAIDQGTDPATAAAQVPAGGAEALYWLALATFAGAQTRGFAAVLAVKTSALAEMERAVALDERVDFAGPHRALGAWLATLPTGAGGSAAAARAHFDRAFALSPDYALTRVKEAETYAVLVQDRSLFESSLSGVLAAGPPVHAEVAPENQLAKKLAQALLDQAKRLF